MDTVLSVATIACGNGEYQKAFGLLHTHLQENRDDGRAWELLGVALQVVGDFEGSVSALERASLLVPLVSNARICIAMGYGKLGRTQLSRELLTALIDDVSMTADQLTDVATGLDFVDATGMAVRACRRAIELEPESAHPYYALGYYASKCGQPAEYVVSLAHKAISLDPGCVKFRVGLASLLTKLSRSDEAYVVVKDLSDEQIDLIDCRCCIERIIPLYDAAGDVRRAGLCRARHFA